MVYVSLVNLAWSVKITGASLTPFSWYRKRSPCPSSVVSPLVLVPELALKWVSAYHPMIITSGTIRGKTTARTSRNDSIILLYTLSPPIIGYLLCEFQAILVRDSLFAIS